MIHSDQQIRLITAKRPSLAERICLYIYNSDISQLAILNESLLAEIFNVPREKLCKRFARKMEKSLDTFLNEQRLFIIHSRIFNRRCNAANLPELSRKIGFLNYWDFNERFFKWLGITPQRLIEIAEERYRKRKREITLLCMYLNSWEEDSPKHPGTKIRKVCLNYDPDILNSMDYDSLVEQFPSSINLTDEGIARAEKLKKMYFQGDIRV